MLEDDNIGSTGDLDSAAQCANPNWDGVPHSAKSDLAEATILPPQKRNRRWDPREKARITAESFEPGANISAVARRHGVSLGLLHYWRRTVRDRATVEPISFVPLELDDGARAAEGSLEIDFDSAHVVVRGAVVNRRPIGTPYRRAKGTPSALLGSVDSGRGFRAAGGVGRA